MRISLRWLREYVPVSLSPEELAHKLTMAGVEVGEITRVGGSWDNIFVGHVVKVEKHPNADRLVVSSPPYNIGKPYEQRVALEEYLDVQLLVLRECVRILQPDGNLCWEVGNHADSGEIFPLDFFFYRILKEELKLKLRNRIVWHFGHGLHASKRFSGEDVKPFYGKRN